LTEKYKAVFFDAGGTLLRPFPSVGEIYRDVAARYGCLTDCKTLETLFRTAWLHRDGLTSLVSHSDEKKEKQWWRSLVHEVFSAVGGVDPFEEFFDELYDLFGHPSVWRLYPGTLELLQQLKDKGYFLGIISNWDSRLHQLVEKFELSRYFEFVLASACVGSAKPGKAIFEMALQKANVKADEAVHIGDSIEDDIRGAQSAGLAAILINRHPERSSKLAESFKHVRVIHNLAELSRIF